MPSAASQAASPASISAGLAKGANAATTITCDRQVAGAIDTSWRQRVITIIRANASTTTNARTSPARLPAPGSPSISVTPTRAMAIAATVRRVIGSPSVTQARSAASTGARARMNRTRATLVWLSAATKLAEAVATHSATAMPARPMDLNDWTTRPRSTTAT